MSWHESRVWEQWSLWFGHRISIRVCCSAIDSVLEYVVHGAGTKYWNLWSAGHGLSTGIWSAGHGLSVGICGLQGLLYWSSWCEHGLSIGVYGPGMDSESVI